MGELVKAKTRFRRPQRSSAQKKGLSANWDCHQEALSTSYFPCPLRKGTLCNTKTNTNSRISQTQPMSWPLEIISISKNIKVFSFLISSVFRILWHIKGATIEVVPSRLFSPSPLTNKLWIHKSGMRSRKLISNKHLTHRTVIQMIQIVCGCLLGTFCTVDSI